MLWDSAWLSKDAKTASPQKRQLQTVTGAKAQKAEYSVKNKSELKDSAKSCSFGLKAASTTPTPEQLAKINQLTKRVFTADELYIGQMRLANNAIDRDNERFSEFTLQGFAATCHRKTVLIDHTCSMKSAVGKFFDCELEKMPLAQAILETGSELKLPEGMGEVQFVTPSFYIPKAAISAEDLVKLEAGIFDFVSIGFKTPWPVPVSDAQGNTLYYEYKGPGETREGSLVYLGAQHGASVKSADNNNEQDHKTAHKEGEQSMKILIAGVGALLGKSFGDATGEQALLDEVKSALSGKDTKITDLETEIKTLKPLAEEGKSYRDGMVGDTVKFLTLAGSVKSDADSQKKEADFLSTLPLDRLKTMKEKAESEARIKNPTHADFKGKATGTQADPDENRKSAVDLISAGMSK